MTRRFETAYAALLAVAAILTGWALYLIFLVAPEERVMGAVQKIFYIHVPLAAATFLSVFILLAGGVGYLWTRRAVWDHLAIAACEIGLVFCSLVLITGPIWAKSAWGVWWTWEAKLTTTLILWLLLAGCRLARGYAATPEQGARVGAVLGIVAALDVPIVYKAVDWWRGQHPIVFGPGRTDPLAPGMKLAFQTSMIAVLFVYVVLLLARVRIASMEDRIAELEEAGGRFR